MTEELKESNIKITLDGKVITLEQLEEAKDFKILIRAWGECEKEEEII